MNTEKKENQLFLDSWRLKPFNNKKCELFSYPDYITCNVRYSHILPDLNNTENHVLGIYNFLSNNFPKGP